MSLRALRILLAIARHGTFARAGEAVGLTQSAVSLQVKALETEFGIRLFDRSRRQPVLTDAGRKLVAQAEEVIAIYDRIPELLSEDSALTGRLRLGAVQTALSGPLPDALVALRHAHPRLRVHVSSGMSAELAQRVVTGDLDAAITTAPVRPHPPNLTWTPLYEDLFWILAPAGEQKRDLSELLRDLPFIQFGDRAWAGRMIDRELRRLGLQAQQRMSLDSHEVIVRMVASGLGVAIVPIPDEILPDLPPIHRTPFGQPQLRRSVVLLERKERPARRLVAAVGDAVARTIRKS